AGTKCEADVIESGGTVGIDDRQPTDFDPGLRTYVFTLSFRGSQHRSIPLHPKGNASVVIPDLMPGIRFTPAPASGSMVDPGDKPRDGRSCDLVSTDHHCPKPLAMVSTVTSRSFR